MLEVGGGDEQRLVVDVQLHQLGVGDVDDRLAGLGERERVLGVLDVPRLVEAVEVGAVAVRLAALGGVGAHPDVAVAEGEQGLGHTEVLRLVLALDESPRIDREPDGVEAGRHVAEPHGCSVLDRVVDRLAEVVDDRIGAVGGERRGVVAAVDAEHETEAAVLAGGDSRDRVLDDDRPVGRDAEQLGGPQERLGRRFPGEPLGRRHHPVDHDAEAVVEPGRGEHPVGVLRRRHDRLWHPGRRRAGPSRPTTRGTARFPRPRAPR